MLSVYQPWDPLKVCVVGRGYGPEHYSWIQDAKIRNIFEKIAIEGEEDLQAFIKILEKFDVKVLRPDLPKLPTVDGIHLKPPLLPRDHIGMIGNTLYENTSFNFKSFYNSVKDPNWPECASLVEFYSLPAHIRQECIEVHNINYFKDQYNCYGNIINFVRLQGNAVKSHVRNELDLCNRAMIYPCGVDYYIGTWDFNNQSHGRLYQHTSDEIQDFISKEFPYTKNHIINTGGHIDASFTIVKPGLIFSDHGNYDLEKRFPGWDIVRFLSTVSYYARSESMNHERNYYYNYLNFENDPAIKSLVEKHLLHWVGDSKETVFDVNVFNIDEHNVVVNGSNDEQIRALERHGITAHHINLRHKWFWDGGIHCLTSDLHREGEPRNLFA